MQNEKITELLAPAGLPRQSIKKTKVELLAPAGSPEKMKYALAYGADAIYAGVPDFSLRARINDFNWESLKEGVVYAHKLGKKFYVTLNIYAHNAHLKRLENDLEKLKDVKPDAVLISDPGIFDLVKEKLPEMEIHLSTQANATNWRAVKFWEKQGIRRVVLAREVTLAEIEEIKKNVPDVELEYFVHGAMCMSYSGRCILSKWMTNRSANLGDCVQPCRWAYRAKSKVESLKSKDVEEYSFDYKTMEVEDIKGEHKVELEEDDNGTYFFNSKDLNLIGYLADLADAGVESFKIEGRNKSVYYLAMVVRAYRNVLDSIGKKDYEKVLKTEKENLNSLFHRGYTEGFLSGNGPARNTTSLENSEKKLCTSIVLHNDVGCHSVAGGPEHNFENSHNAPKWEFVGEVLECKNGLAKIKPHNAIYADDEIEIIDKSGNCKIKLEKIFNEKMEDVQSAHGGQGKFYYLQIDKKSIKPMALIRKML